MEALALVGAATFLESYAGDVEGQAIIGHCRVQHSAQTYAALFAAGARAWLIELAPGGAPIGYAVLARPDLPGAGSKDIELKRIYVLSRFHRLRIGSTLMQIALDASAGFDRVMLGVYKQNERALAFYRRNGFSIAGERKFHVADAEYNDWVLARAPALQDTEIS